MSDSHLRVLEHIWRMTGSWSDWRAWARETRRTSSPDPARLLAAIERLAILERRVLRISFAAGRLPNQGRAEEALSRTLIERELLRRRVGRLARRVPTPRVEDDDKDIAAAGVRLGQTSIAVFRAAKAMARARSDPRRVAVLEPLCPACGHVDHGAEECSFGEPYSAIAPPCSCPWTPGTGTVPLVEPSR
jgi:hypothetical protein